MREWTQCLVRNQICTNDVVSFEEIIYGTCLVARENGLSPNLLTFIVFPISFPTSDFLLYYNISLGLAIIYKSRVTRHRLSARQGIFTAA